MDKLRRFLSGNDTQDDEESGIMAQVSVEKHLNYEITQPNSLSQISDSSTLSWSTRIKGFLICFIVGILLSFLGSFALFLHNGLKVFAVFYTFGNIVSIASTCFLMGPVNQMKKMFAPTRVIATIIVFVAFALTLFAAIGVS